MPAPRQLIFISIVAAAAGYFAVDDYLRRELASLPAREQAREADEVKNIAGRAKVRRAQAEQEKAASRAAEEKKLRSTMGDSYEAIAKDPFLDLSGMLLETARKAAPEGAKVGVRTERFTNFQLLIDLPVPLRVSELIPIARPIFEHGAPYLVRLSFYQGKKFLGELDWRALTILSQSKQPQESEYQTLFDASLGDPSGAKPPAGAGLDNDDTPNGRYRKTVTDWRAAYDAHVAMVNESIQNINRAIAIKGMAGKNDLASHIELAEEAGRQIRESEKFFTEAMSQLRRKLEGGDFDALLVTVTLREAERSVASHLQPIQTLLIRLIAHQANARQLLQDLRDRFSEWRMSPDGRVEFANPKAAVAFQNDVSAVNVSSQQVEGAARDLRAR